MNIQPTTNNNIEDEPAEQSRPLNDYGYETFEAVPLPEGEKRIGERSPKKGERYLTVIDGKPSYPAIAQESFDSDVTRIILAPVRAGDPRFWNLK